MKRAVCLLALSLLALPGCGPSHASPLKQAPVPVQTQSNRTVMIMAGKIDAAEKADITSKIAAKVVAVNVDIGSVVAKGAPLIVLDTRDLQAQLGQAEAGEYTAEANLIKVQSGARTEQINQAKAALESASQNYELAKVNYRRMSQLYQTEVISKLQLETAEAQLKSAEAQYVSAKNTLEMLNQGETPETLNVLKAQVKQAQAASNVIKTQLSNGVITAPVSGVVSAKNINPGEMATVGPPLVSVVNLDSLFINAYLPASLIEKVKIGQEVIVKVSELPSQTFSGRITVISPVIDPKGKTVQIKVKLLNPSAVLKPGMFAEIGLK